MTRPFWTDDNAESRYLAEHGAVSRFDGDELVIEAGNEALLPPWPPSGYNETGPSVVGSTGTANVLCAVCATPVVRHGDAGWRHEVSYAERGGCSTPWPRADPRPRSEP